MAVLLSIGRVAELASVTPDTIRYYERLGLVPKPPRTPAGYRQYSAGIVRRLAVVKNAQRFGFSLKEISGFLRVREAGGIPCHDVRAAAQRMLEAMNGQITEMIAARKAMRQTIRSWDRKLARTPPNRQAHLLEDLG